MLGVVKIHHIYLLFPVAVRNQISSLRHSIRQQQAQVHNLENVILRGPRPYADISFSDSMSTPSPASPPSATAKLPRRTSFEVLSGIAGPDSNLPLPTLQREMNGLDDNGGIREGIPMSFGAGSSTPTHHKRPSSPTRTLSRASFFS
jgi:hypothetical protein